MRASASHAAFAVILSGALMTSCAQGYAGKGRAADVKVITDIEGGNVHNVLRISENRLSVEMRPDKPSVYTYPDHYSYWFYFRVTGVAGREIRFDITNCDWMPKHWLKYKPVYTYAEDPDDPGGGPWQRIENTLLEGRTFSFTQAFTEDAAWIALRYPYSLTREKRYVRSIEGNAFARVEELGRTALDNPLYMITVTDGETPPGGKKGVLVVAREHGVEQDGSWVAEGMIDFLLSDAPAAAALRRDFVFMIVPVIAPDAAAAGRAVDPTTGKHAGMEFWEERMDSIEVHLLFARMEKFVADGGTLSVALSLHTPHGAEPNLYPNYLPHNNFARLIELKKLHRAIARNASGYTVGKELTPRLGAYSVGRFARDFGSLSVLYEVNHQADGSFLEPQRLKGMGEVFLRGLADYYGVKG